MNTDYRYIELVEGGANKRPGQIVELPVDFPDYYGKAAAVDAYASVYRFDGGLNDYVSRTGSIRGYEGNCKATGIHFDFDGASALADIRAFIESICRNDSLGVYIDMIRLFFSGNKGFHLHISHPDIEALPPGKDVPEKIKHMASLLAGKFTAFDRAVYDKTRIFRICNSKHGKSGLFKIPLLAMEIFNYDIDRIKTIARFQRSINDAVSQWMKTREVF